MNQIESLGPAFSARPDRNAPAGAFRVDGTYVRAFYVAGLWVAPGLLTGWNVTAHTKAALDLWLTLAKSLNFGKAAK